MSEKNVYQRVLGVMDEVKDVKKADKSSNGFYPYIEHDEVTKELHPAFVNNGLVVIPSIEEMKQDGNRTEIKLFVAFINADKPDDRFNVYSHGYGIDKGDKGIGKAYSYAYKYALLKTFALNGGKNDDPESDPSATYQPEREQKIDADDIIKLQTFCEDRNINLDTALKEMHVALNEITKDGLKDVARNIANLFPKKKEEQ